MGGTIVLPGTNRSVRAHSALGADEGGVGMLTDPRRWPQLRFQGSVGDAMLMDSRVLHCGGANTSCQRRRLLYMTFKLPDCNPAGSTYSLLREYTDLLVLGNWQGWGYWADDRDGDERCGDDADSERGAHHAEPSDTPEPPPRSRSHSRQATPLEVGPLVHRH